MFLLWSQVRSGFILLSLTNFVTWGKWFYFLIPLLSFVKWRVPRQPSSWRGLEKVSVKCKVGAERLFLFSWKAPCIRVSPCRWSCARRWHTEVGRPLSYKKFKLTDTARLLFGSFRGAKIPHSNHWVIYAVQCWVVWLEKWPWHCHSSSEVCG